MEKDIENRSDTDEKKQVSIGKETNRRLDPSRCCFGLLSLRSGIYVVSVTTFILSLYGLTDEPSGSEENLEIVRSLPTWTNSAFLGLSFCTEVTGLYGAYKKSAKLIKAYKRMIGVELVLELACAVVIYKNVYTRHTSAEWVRNLGQEDEWKRRVFNLTLIGIGSIGIIVPVTAEGFRIYLAGRYQRFLEEEDKNDSSKD